MEITKNHKRLQETTISQQNLESEIHEQMHRKSSKKKQKIWTQQLQALILKCFEIFQLTKLKADGVTEKFYEWVRELLTHTHLNLFKNSRVEGKPTNRGGHP